MKRSVVQVGQREDFWIFFLEPSVPVGSFLVFFLGAQVSCSSPLVGSFLVFPPVPGRSFEPVSGKVVAFFSPTKLKLSLPALSTALYYFALCKWKKKQQIM